MNHTDFFETNKLETITEAPPLSEAEHAVHQEYCDCVKETYRRLAVGLQDYFQSEAARFSRLHGQSPILPMAFSNAAANALIESLAEYLGRLEFLSQNNNSFDVTAQKPRQDKIDALVDDWYQRLQVLAASVLEVETHDMASYFQSTNESEKATS